MDLNEDGGVVMCHTSSRRSKSRGREDGVPQYIHDRILLLCYENDPDHLTPAIDDHRYIQGSTSLHFSADVRHGNIIHPYLLLVILSSCSHVSSQADVALTGCPLS